MPHLALDDLHAAYGGLEVLHGIGFTVDRGQVVSLVGPSGSGKSTVLRTLMGLTPVTKGHVEVDGERIDYSSGRAIRAARDRMAIVFQQYNLFQNMNVLQNVMLAPVKIKRRPRAQVEREAMELLDLVGLADRRDAYPEALSGGQQQRVAIARALALHPEILLLDEITSALDPELVNEVLDTVRRLAREGMTMLLVSHEMSFVREVSNAVVFMDKGRVVERGPPDRIFTAPESDRARDFFGKILRG